ncbi:MAG: flavodoxin domain-containing protein [Methanoregula sp.]|jgi:menaquinone-dependent protoporphyrinogen oxidase
MARILVAYASKKGSTAEIAQAMGKEIRAAGHLVDVTEMKSVSSVGGYNAVVIGGPFYMGKVTDMGKFIGRYRDALAKVPLAAFAVGLAPLGKDPADKENAMKKLQKTLEPLTPVALTIFAGRLDPAKLSWFQKWITQKVKSPVGDFRDWTAIAAWARELPAKMGV